MRSNNRITGIRLIATVFLFAVQSIGCAPRHHIPPGMIPPIPKPEHTDKEIVKSFALQFAAKRAGSPLTLVSEGESVTRLQTVLDKILKANNSEHQFHAFVLADNTRNAFTDGKAIYVHAELYNKLRNENDIAAIVSHELAHMTAGHTSIGRKELEQRQRVVAVLSAVLGAAAGIAHARSSPYVSPQDAQNTASNVGNLSKFVGFAANVAPYRRDQEHEADEVGMFMAARAQYDPEEFLDFWKNAEQILGPSSSDLLSTHPTNAARFARLENFLPIANDYYRCSMVTKDSKMDKDKNKDKGKAKKKNKDQEKNEDKELIQFCEDFVRKHQCIQEFCLETRQKNFVKP